MEETELLKNLE